MRLIPVLFALSATLLATACSRDTMSGGEDRGERTASLVAHMSALAEEPANAGTCDAEIGAAEALKLRQQCKAVSPDSEPNCNANSTCQSMRQEIGRSCASYSAHSSRPPACEGVTEG